MNFIIGENNIGKTNVLDLLNIIFNRRGFDEIDFTNKDNPIEIKMTLKLDKEEIGVFDDYFSISEDNKMINIMVIQNTVEDNIKYYEERTGDEMFRPNIRAAHFISYGSVRNPDKELSFHGKGNNFLQIVIEKIMENQGKLEFLNAEIIERLVDAINIHIKKLQTFNLFNIEAKADENIGSLLGRIIQLQADDKFELKDLGEGTQFLNSIPLVLLNQIANICNNKQREAVLEIDGKRVLNVIISIDEPELHLHPHSQKYFINYINDILASNDNKFNELLKYIFNIDAIKGQLLIVTHSPFILYNDYKQLIRLYKESQNLLVVKNGTDINIEENLEKHLYRFFDNLKEAFYSKKVLIVEGETEFGAIYPFFEKEGIDVAKEGISVINSHGVERVPQLMKLFKEFGLKVVGIIDRDDGNIENKVNYQGIDNLFQTQLREFEDDIVECYNLGNFIDYCNSLGLILSNQVMGTAKQLDIDLDPRSTISLEDQLRNLLDDEKDKLYRGLKENFIKSLKETSKGFINGMIVAEHAVETPLSFKKAMDCLVRLDG